MSNPVREPVRIRLVRLIAAALAAPIAHDHAVNNRDEEVMQPLRLRGFLERHVNGSPHAAEVLDECEASVGKMLRAITRPIGSRTELTVVA